MPDQNTLFASMLTWWAESPVNHVEADYALRPELAGMPMFEEPLIRVSSADDPLYLKMKEPGVIGPHFLLPEEWLPGAKSVITFFFPFTAEVRKTNRRSIEWTSSEWMHARIEGELAICSFKDEFCRRLGSLGYAAMYPGRDSRYSVQEPVNSNWSERHAAFISGLGTFGLSRNLITEKGTAGRFGSIITTAELVPDERPYSDVYEYCTRCGACIHQCPAHAIALTEDPNLAKDQYLCGTYLQPLKDVAAAHGDVRPPEEQDDYMPPKFRKHFGCGKCQVKVPCEARRP